MLKVHNFENFQHYRHRSPIWIKMYRSLLRDYKFQQLPDAARSHLMLIWLLASELDNQIENDPEWVRRQINSSEPVDLQLLISSGFLVDLDSAVQQNGQNPASKVLLEPKPDDSDDSIEQSRAEQRKSRAEKEAEQSRAEANLPALPAAANGFDEKHSSGFSRSEVEDFVRATKPHAKNPGGLARKIWRDGSEDDQIEQWRKPRDEIIWPKWVMSGDVEANKRLHLRMIENQRALEAESEQPAADEAA